MDNHDYYVAQVENKGARGIMYSLQHRVLDNGINEYFEQSTNNDVRTVTTLAINPNAQRAGVSIVTTQENLLTGEYNEKHTFVPA